MKYELRELKIKLQFNKGSVLVYTLIIMMILLAAALSVATVAVKERRGAGTTSQSTQSFAVADSGSEIALKKIAGGSGALSSIGCADGQLTGNIGSGKNYTVTFYDSDGNLLSCSDQISDVDKVKSVGTYAGTTRAVEVVVMQQAIAGCPSAIRFATGATDDYNLSGAVEKCRNLNNDWHLPTVKELACFLDENIFNGVVAPNYAWTRTPSYNDVSDKWIALAKGGAGTSSTSDVLHRVLCVRWAE